MRHRKQAAGNETPALPQIDLRTGHELDVDGRPSLYVQAQKSEAPHGVHPRGAEALHEFRKLQNEVAQRVRLAAEPGRPPRHRARAIVLSVATLLVLLAGTVGIYLAR